MIRQKTTASKAVRILMGIGMFLLLCWLFIGITPLRAYATTGSDLDTQNKFRVTYYWDVKNAYESADNYMGLYTKGVSAKWNEEDFKVDDVYLIDEYDQHIGEPFNSHG